MATVLNDNIDIKAPKRLDNRESFNGTRPYVDKAEALRTVSLENRTPTLSAYILNDKGLVDEWWYRNNITDEGLELKSIDIDLSDFDFSQYAKSGGSKNTLKSVENRIDHLPVDGVPIGSLPIYSDLVDVPTSFPEEAADEYLVVTETSQRFTEEEKFGMILESIAELHASVEKIKNTMFSHMDLGTIKNSTLSNTLADINYTPAIEPIWAGDTGKTIVEDDWTEIIESEPEADEYFKISHLSIKSGTEAEYLEHGNMLLPFELFWLTDVKRLYIKQPDGSVYWLNRSGSGEGTIDPDEPTPQLPNMENIESIGFIAPDKTKYRVTVTNEGELDVVNETMANAPDASKVMTTGAFTGLSETLYEEKLYINSLYCGGIAAENIPKYQGCSHNFVELSNLTEKDISLNGLSLQYAISGTQWDILPLKGVIKKDSTFLIRGAKCSVLDVNTTIIHVDEYDMEWIGKTGKPITFSNIKSKFALTYGTDPLPQKPYRQDLSVGAKAYVKLGYIDMVGLNKPLADGSEVIDAAENNPVAHLMPNRIFLKYFAMDPVKQATKKIGARNNAKDWMWIELDANIHPDLEDYTPRASYENKGLFYNKTELGDTPELVTVTFGIDAHKTRCFNWISKGYYDEFIWIKRPGGEFEKFESFKEGDGRTLHTSIYYNRIRVVATSKVGYTSHKFIITGLNPGEYEYKMGSEGRETEVRKFKVTAKNSEPFKFVQHTDQQSFNWQEYEVWRLSADYIREHHNPLFTVNTGDMTQNGNRINEWLDYYKAGENLFKGNNFKGQEFNGVEQMNTIGNNDLSPENFEIIDSGSDMQKVNPINFLFFYTYEIDPENPPVITVKGNDYYVPSLYSFNYNDTHFMIVNSEIPKLSQEVIFGMPKPQDMGNPENKDIKDVYEFMKDWCTADLDKYSTTHPVKIAVMHEMPFTIITNAMVKNFSTNPEYARGGSRLNTDTDSDNVYWFSQLLEEKGVQLCIGGHKHTYTVSHPIRENVTKDEEGVVIARETMKPIIETTDPQFVENNNLTDDDLDLCEIDVVTKVSAPVYTMCQATGYKQTSNKELPASRIPWLKNYFPCNTDGTKDTPNIGQQMPFFIEWEISGTHIIGNVVKLDNIMSDGNFNINLPNRLPITALNGNGSSNEPITIIL